MQSRVLSPVMEVWSVYLHQEHNCCPAKVGYLVLITYTKEHKELVPSQTDHFMIMPTGGGGVMWTLLWFYQVLKLAW